jgi:hypothetical protein
MEAAVAQPFGSGAPRQPATSSGCIGQGWAPASSAAQARAARTAQFCDFVVQYILVTAI